VSKVLCVDLWLRFLRQGVGDKAAVGVLVASAPAAPGTDVAVAVGVGVSVTGVIGTGVAVGCCTGGLANQDLSGSTVVFVNTNTELLSGVFT
jgi:hypothetical protein